MHCANLSPMISIKQYSFATRLSLQIVISAFRCKDVRLCKPRSKLGFARSLATLFVPIGRRYDVTVWL
jgi:hypothetical protein